MDRSYRYQRDSLNHWYHWNSNYDEDDFIVHYGPYFSYNSMGRNPQRRINRNRNFRGRKSEKYSSTSVRHNTTQIKDSDASTSNTEKTEQNKEENQIKDEDNLLPYIDTLSSFLSPKSMEEFENEAKNFEIKRDDFKIDLTKEEDIENNKTDLEKSDNNRSEDERNEPVNELNTLSGNNTCTSKESGTFSENHIPNILISDNERRENNSSPNTENKNNSISNQEKTIPEQLPSPEMGMTVSDYNKYCEKNNIKFISVIEEDPLLGVAIINKHLMPNDIKTADVKNTPVDNKPKENMHKTSKKDPHSNKCHSTKIVQKQSQSSQDSRQNISTSKNKMEQAKSCNKTIETVERKKVLDKQLEESLWKLVDPKKERILNIMSKEYYIAEDLKSKLIKNSNTEKEKLINKGANTIQDVRIQNQIDLLHKTSKTNANGDININTNINANWKMDEKLIIQKPIVPLTKLKSSIINNKSDENSDKKASETKKHVDRKTSLKEKRKLDTCLDKNSKISKMDDPSMMKDMHSSNEMVSSLEHKIKIDSSSEKSTKCQKNENNRDQQRKKTLYTSKEHSANTESKESSYKAKNKISSKRSDLQSYRKNKSQPWDYKLRNIIHAGQTPKRNLSDNCPNYASQESCKKNFPNNTEDIEKKMFIMFENNLEGNYLNPTENSANCFKVPENKLQLPIPSPEMENNLEFINESPNNNFYETSTKVISSNNNNLDACKKIAINSVKTQDTLNATKSTTGNNTTDLNDTSEHLISIQKNNTNTKLVLESDYRNCSSKHNNRDLYLHRKVTNDSMKTKETPNVTTDTTGNNNMDLINTSEQLVGIQKSNTNTKLISETENQSCSLKHNKRDLYIYRNVTNNLMKTKDTPNVNKDMTTGNNMMNLNDTSEQLISIQKNNTNTEISSEQKQNHLSKNNSPNTYEKVTNNSMKTKDTPNVNKDTTTGNNMMNLNDTSEQIICIQKSNTNIEISPEKKQNHLSKDNSPNTYEKVTNNSMKTKGTSNTTKDMTTENNMINLNDTSEYLVGIEKNNINSQLILEAESQNYSSENYNSEIHRKVTNYTQDTLNVTQNLTTESNKINLNYASEHLADIQENNTSKLYPSDDKYQYVKTNVNRESCDKTVNENPAQITVSTIINDNSNETGNHNLQDYGITSTVSLNSPVSSEPTFKSPVYQNCENGNTIKNKSVENTKLQSEEDIIDLTYDDFIKKENEEVIEIPDCSTTPGIRVKSLSTLTFTEKDKEIGTFFIKTILYTRQYNERIKSMKNIELLQEECHYSEYLILKANNIIDILLEYMKEFTKTETYDKFTQIINNLCKNNKFVESELEDIIGHLLKLMPPLRNEFTKTVKMYTTLNNLDISNNQQESLNNQTVQIPANNTNFNAIASVQIPPDNSNFNAMSSVQIPVNSNFNTMPPVQLSNTNTNLNAMSSVPDSSIYPYNNQSFCNDNSALYVNSTNDVNNANTLNRELFNMSFIPQYSANSLQVTKSSNHSVSVPYQRNLPLHNQGNSYSSNNSIYESQVNAQNNIIQQPNLIANEAVNISYHHAINTDFSNNSNQRRQPLQLNNYNLSRTSNTVNNASTMRGNLYNRSDTTTVVNYNNVVHSANNNRSGIIQRIECNNPNSSTNNIPSNPVSQIQAVAEANSVNRVNLNNSNARTQLLHKQQFSNSATAATPSQIPPQNFCITNDTQQPRNNAPNATNQYSSTVNLHNFNSTDLSYNLASSQNISSSHSQPFVSPSNHTSSTNTQRKTNKVPRQTSRRALKQIPDVQPNSVPVHRQQSPQTQQNVQGSNVNITSNQSTLQNINPESLSGLNSNLNCATYNPQNQSIPSLSVTMNSPSQISRSLPYLNSFVQSYSYSQAQGCMQTNRTNKQ